MAKTKYPRKYQHALAVLYREAGVGRTVRQRLAYWNKECPNTNIYCGVGAVPDALQVAVHESSWLSDRFPMDFRFC